MKPVLAALYWEILWKNRVVFPALAVMLALGAGLGIAGRMAGSEAQWLSEAKTLTVLAFLISLLVGFTPFTLMESSGGWRMNSTLTRWFSLPVKTVYLVYVPMLAACLFISGLIATWVLVLNLIVPGLDGLYLGAVLVVTQVAFTAWAWTVPRKPLQYWMGVALLFPVALIAAFGPQDVPGNERFRLGMLIPLGGILAVLLPYTWLAAAKSRCGAWPGELPFDRLFSLFRFRAPKNRVLRAYVSQNTALVRASAWPNLKMLALSWFGLMAVLFFYVSYVVRESHPDIAFTWRILPMAGLGLLPILAVPWLAIWGLFAAGEPAAAFRTRLASFTATLPITSGSMAATKIIMLAAGWALVWVPLAAMTFAYSPAVLGIETEDMTTMQVFVARLMASCSFIVIGALPLYLWGRFEGFPNVLLAAICAWALAWGIGAPFALEEGESPGKLWVLLAIALTMKFGLGAYGFAKAWREGHTSWRYPLYICAGWILAGALMVLVLPVWKYGGVFAALTLMLRVPFARLAWCPLAIAANRHR